MEYILIFSAGYTDDREAIMKGYRSDVILMDENKDCYELNFIELEVIRNGFDSSKVCYLENNLVIVHKVTKENIISSIRHLHDWKFQQQWRPLNQEQIAKYYPNEALWVTYLVEID